MVVNKKIFTFVIWKNITKHIYEWCWCKWICPVI